MRILGISALRRDAAAALIINGKVVATAQEERLTKERLASGIPKRSIRYCLDAGGIQARDIDQVVFYEKPLRLFERVLVSDLRAFPKSAKSFSKNMFGWLGERLWVRGEIAEEVGVEEKRVHFCEHAMSHAAAAYYTSPFCVDGDAAVLVLDDVGEWATTLMASGKGSQLESVAELHHPNSLGLFASAMTQFLGFEAGSDERLVESLSSWGEPKMKAQLDSLLKPLDGGRFEVDGTAFRFGFDQEVLFGQALVEKLGDHREPGGALRYTGGDRRDADMAASLQAVLEERALALCEELHRRVPSDALCLGGMLASNTRLVTRILKDGPFKHVHVPQAPGKAGAALGAALLAYHTAEGAADSPENEPNIDLNFQAAEGATELADQAAARGLIVERLAKGESVGWLHGLIELGPRSLRSRVLLVDARLEDARDILLGAVQRAEDYQPSCLVMPKSRAAEFVELPAGRSAEASLAQGQLCVPATAALRAQAPGALAPDGSVCVRLVDAASEPEFAALLNEFEAATGSCLLLSESFHLRGAPIVRTELDASDAFQRSTIGVLVCDTRLYERSS